MPIYAPNGEFAGPPDVEAEITFVSTQAGGRSTPAFSRYSPQFHFDGDDWDAVHDYPDVEAVYPGQTARALLRFIRPEYVVGRIYPGLEFQIREGERVVAHGKVTKILRLAESAERYGKK
jgi:translation elongation factor EF-Tu-like GTPase